MDLRMKLRGETDHCFDFLSWDLFIDDEEQHRICLEDEEKSIVFPSMNASQQTTLSNPWILRQILFVTSAKLDGKNKAVRIKSLTFFLPENPFEKKTKILFKCFIGLLLASKENQRRKKFAFSLIKDEKQSDCNQFSLWSPLFFWVKQWICTILGRCR